MKTKLIAVTMAALTLLAAPNIGAQVANYRGRTYTPGSFPRAQYCSCSMCRAIRAQWSATAPQPRRAVLTAPAPTGSYHTIAPIRTAQAASLLRTEPASGVWVTEFRETWVKTGCINGVCQFRRSVRPVRVFKRVTGYSSPKVSKVDTFQAPKPAPKVSKVDTLEAPKVPEPVPSEAPKFDTFAKAEVAPISTPQKVVDAMLAALSPPKNAKLFDLGCGDGRVLITAVLGYGCRAVGIEIDKETAEEARQNALNNFVSPSVFVFNGDATDYDLAEAEYATMYLYDDLIEELTAKLSSGTKVASYAHPLPNLDDVQQHAVTIGETDHVFYTGVIR